MRLAFAESLPLEEHLARHRLADLFLDTLPVNAHTTASDALWAGLPILTCCGQSFSGRVAASLLHAIGLPELVTHNFNDYEALAQLIRLGWFRPVHAKSIGSQEMRALLVARKQLLGRLVDVELSIRGYCVTSAKRSAR